MAGGPNVGGGKRGGAAQTVGVLNLLTDLAFNLLIFFVVCASTTPEKGRPQQVPSASKDKPNEDKALNVEIAITRTTVKVNNAEVPDADLPAKLKEVLAGKNRPEDRIVIVSSEPDTPYSRWIKITGQIEQAGGVITLQLKEEKEVQVR